MIKRIGFKNLMFSAAIGLMILGAAFMMEGVDQSVAVDAGIGDIAYEVDSTTKVGQLYLEVSQSEEWETASVLMNGVAYALLDSAKKTIDIPDGCVVEIDSRKVSGPVTVSIVGKSAGVLTDCVGRSITVNKGIANLGTFLVGTEKK